MNRQLHFIFLAPKFSGIEVILQKLNQDFGYYVIDSEEKLDKMDDPFHSIFLYHFVNPRKIIKRMNWNSLVYIFDFDITTLDLYEKRKKLSFDFFYYFKGFYEPQIQGIDDITLKPLKSPIESKRIPSNWDITSTHKIDFNRDMDVVYDELVDLMEDLTNTKPSFLSRFKKHFLDDTINIIFEMVPKYSHYKNALKIFLAPFY